MMNKAEYLLVCLMEEASEVQQIAAKCLRFGMDNHHPDRADVTNAEELQRELMDFASIRYMLMEEGVLSDKATRVYNMSPKIKKVMHYMDVSKACGTLESELGIQAAQGGAEE